MSNPEVELSLDEAVAEVLGLLTGLDLQYDPELDRYGAITRQINRALRSNALEHEWSYYSTVQSIGQAQLGEREIWLQSSLRPRIVSDDAVRLCRDDVPIVWAYFLPRDAIHKYPQRAGLWCSVTRNTILFNRAFNTLEDGLDVQLPVMREPAMFRLPVQPEDPNEPLVPVPAEVRESTVDFAWPDVIILRAAFYYAQTDPVMQPRVQTLEAQYKDLMYQIIERDASITDTPFQNNFLVPVQGGIYGDPTPTGMPLSDERS